MRALNKVYLNVVLPFFEPKSFRGASTLFRKYEESEKLPLEENQRRQWKTLQKLLQYSYDNTSFYRKRFDAAGLRPNSIQSPDDLRELPVLTRGDIVGQLEEMRSHEFAKGLLQRASTGGTTDTPVAILRDPGSILEKVATQMRFNAWAGLLPGDKVMHLWGAVQDYSPNPSLRWRLYDRYVMKRVWAPVSMLNQEIFEKHRAMMNEFRPRILYAYPTPLALLCEYLRDSKKPFQRPVSAICTAEALYPDQRKVIEEVLQCRVFEHYGSREFGMIAGECEQHTGMHVNVNGAYLEFLPVANSEIPGLHEVVVTDLLNHGMPLLRYRVNDCAVLGEKECVCGRGYPLIRKIIGRTTDVFQLANGARIPGISLTNRVLSVCPGLVKTQIIQETYQDFRVRYVPGPNFSTADLGLLKTNLQKFVPDLVVWTFEQVSEIPRERSGKTRFCISRVKPIAQTEDHAAMVSSRYKN